jgi:VWA domain-containing protein
MSRRLLVLLVSSLAFAGILRWIVPSGFWRVGGTVDAMVMLDTSGSVGDQLTRYQDAAVALIRELLPGDHLSVIWFDAQVGHIFKGTIRSPQTLETVSEQIRALSLSTQDGTVLPEALSTAGEALEEFANDPEGGVRRQRVLALCSDGQACPVPGSSQESNWDSVRLPGVMTVVAFGFKGLPQDRVVQVLLGSGAEEAKASNDVHLISMDEADRAVKMLAAAVRRAHPLNWVRILLAAGAYLLLATFTLGGDRLFARGRGRLPIETMTVRAFGSSDDHEHFLGEGESVTLGPGEDLPFPTDSAAVLTRIKNHILVAPKTSRDRIFVVRAGDPVPVHEPTPLELGDRLQLDGLQLEVEFSARKRA